MCAVVARSAFWEEIQEIAQSVSDGSTLDHGSLPQLATVLKSVVWMDVAESTRRSYLLTFQRWSRWAHNVSVPVFPGADTHFALYVVHLLQSKFSYAPIAQARGRH